jgi:dTMP kinase
MKKAKSLKKGIFFVIEGIDGAGKSTQIKLLKEWLKSAGHHAVITKEPTEVSSYGKKIRDSIKKKERFAPEEELNLFMSDRREHLDNLITPALDDKKVVICDRYYYSNVAYQGAAGLDPKEIQRLNEEFAAVPDAVFYLKVDVGEGLHRVKNIRNSEFTPFEKADFLKKVSAIFDSMDYSYFHTIDANKGAKEVSHKITRIVKDILSKHEE